MKRFIILSIILVLTYTNIKAQCTSCYSSTNTGMYSSVLGRESVSSGYTSFASGIRSKATADFSTAIGFHAEAHGVKGVALGTMVKASVSKSIAIGSGNTNSNTYMENYVPRSLMVGFTSKFPTLFVGEPKDQDNQYTKTGRIAIGNVVNSFGYMEPLTKLHLRADIEEPAIAFIEPHQWKSGAYASLALGSLEHGIGAEYELGLVFQSPTNYVFKKGNVGVGNDIPKYNLDVEGDINFTGQLLYRGEPLNGSLWQQLGSNIAYTTGKVGIGTTNFTGNYGLYVENGILTSEVMVKDPSQWYDIVFDDDYNLMKLDELEHFVQTNKHLPDVPNEESVMKEGYSLTKMNGILLKKVEELTLYIIDQQKMIEEQNTRITALESDK
jgi:hypothetical protein